MHLWAVCGRRTTNSAVTVTVTDCLHCLCSSEMGLRYHFMALVLTSVSAFKYLKETDYTVEK